MRNWIAGIVAAVGAFFTISYWRQKAKVAEIKGQQATNAAVLGADNKAVVDADTALRASIDTDKHNLAELNDPNLKKL